MLRRERTLLQNLSENVRLCYERAAEARERADEMHDPEAKADFLTMERRWLLLARSYEFGERLADFTRENSRRVNSARAFEPPPELQTSACARPQEPILGRRGGRLTLRDWVNAHRLAFNMAGRVNVYGVNIPLTSDWAIQIGIAIRELAANSFKYGALGSNGCVTIIWTVEDKGEEKRNLVFIWDELYSRSETKPGYPGFGHAMLTRIVPARLNGTAFLELEAGALRWTLQAPLID
jgi:hypothetical protein